MMSQELNLEEGITRRFSRAVSRNFQRGTKSTIEIKGVGSIRELPQSCYHLLAEGLLYAKKTLDPRKPIGFWVSLISCVIAVSVDPLFFYVPVLDTRVKCLGFDRKLRISAIVLYAFFGFFYMTYVNFLLPTSLIKNKAKPYLLRFSIIDFLVLFPIPLVLLTLVIEITKMRVEIFLFPISVFLFQYLLRVIRVSVLFTEAIKTSGILAEAKWTKAAFNLLLYLQGGHVFGGLWYFFAIEREVVYWKAACRPDTGYVNGSVSFYCDDRFLYNEFQNVSCTTPDSTVFDFGIFDDALQSGIVERKFFLTKLFYCLRWGVQTLRFVFYNKQQHLLFLRLM
ncbi:hypothetical protein Pint_11094 [Pistacia integerrima]|uniref:Uncharacterized protein n=1 Tax=Pistacia integerrima TaxID=434235 RepID=A0ACC0XFV3_9ROSI|nr:hypothetical protein Pint_11094 [Pistacia integerrima]